MNKKDFQAPFRIKKIKCPCCREFVDVVLLPDLTSHLYWPKKKEDDQHVILWEWKNPKYQHINPSFYDILYCPSCSFADFREEFMSPDINPGNKVKIIREMFLSEKEKKDSLINLFSEKITPENMDPEKAIYLHLLSIMIQELLPGPEPQENPRLSRDWKKLARLYLRTAWLFREENPDQAPKETHEGHLFEVRLFVNSFLKRVQSLKIDIEAILGTLELQQNYEREKKILKKDVYLNYQTSLHKSTNLYNQLKIVAMNLKEMNENHFFLVKDKTPLIDDKFFALRNKLLSYTILWPDIPTSEIDCVKKSAEYFHLAADNDRYSTSIEGLRLLEFGIKLLMRAKLKKTLDSLFKIFVKRASDIRSGFMKKKSSAKSMVDNEKYDSEIRKINNIIQEMSYLYKSHGKE